MAPHFSTLAWKIPCTEEPGGLQSMGTLRVGHDWATSFSLPTFMHWRRKWQPTPVLLPGESQGRGSLVGCCLWGCRVGHDWSDLAAAAAHSCKALGRHYDEVICWLSEHQRRAFRKTGYYKERKKDMNKRELLDEQQRLALIHEIWAWRVPLKNVKKQKFNQVNLVIQLALCSCSWITASHLLIVIKIVNGKY